MGLYDLVTLKTQLTQVLDVAPSIEQLTRLRTAIENSKLQIQKLTADQIKYIDDMVAYYDNIILLVNKPIKTNKEYLERIDSEIHSITRDLFTSNYELEDRPGDVNFSRNYRKIVVDMVAQNLVKNKITTRTSWRYPTLEIGCRDGEWTKYLVAADPLYITDFHQEFIDSAASQFPDGYQRRLRSYRLINHNLKMLPQGVFGFIFSWGYFNFVSVDTMKQYLKQIHELLRPGGIFMFTYNDGDTPSGAGMAENFSQTYMPKSMLIPLVDSIGFELIQESGSSSHISWLEIKRPGELQTIKAHQVLGEIKQRNDSISALTNFNESAIIDNIQENL